MGFFDFLYRRSYTVIMHQENKSSDSVARNTTYYTAALIFQKILAFIYFSLIARFLGVEDTGKYTFALTFTTLFAIFIDLGLGPVLTREIAKAKEKTGQYLSNILALKIPLTCITYLLVDRKSTRLNSSHLPFSRMPPSA